MLSIILDDSIQLRSYQPEDAPELFRVVDENRAHLRQWLNWVDATTAVQHSLQYIQGALAEQQRQESMVLGIFREGQLIGSVGLHGWQQGLKRASIGYWITGAEEGKGIVTRCAGRLIRFGFEKLELNKVELHFVAGNARSAAVAARLGAKTEGVIRAGVLHHGQLKDLVITGILKSEWKMAWFPA